MERQQPKRLNRQQAASFLGVSASTMARWAWERRGPAYHRPSGGRVFYNIDDLIAFQARGRTEPTQ